MISVTLISLDGHTQSSLPKKVDTKKMWNLRSLDPTDLATDAIFEYEVGPAQLQTWIVSENCDTVAALITTDQAESGSEVLTNKATDFGTLNDTLYPTTDAVEDNFAGRHYYAAAGTDTYTATIVPATTPFTGMVLRLKFGVTNTGAATFNAAPIKKGVGGATALSASDLVITKIYTVIFDGTNWQINL